MMAASQDGQEGAVQLLLGAGAVVDSKDCDGWTALASAIRDGHIHVARVILEAGAELPPSKVSGKFRRPNKEMQQLLAFHRDRLRALAAV